MRKIILILINVLFIIILLIMMFKGFSLGNLSVHSFDNIKSESAALDYKINEVKSTQSVYSSSKTQLDDAKNNYNEAKKKYLDLVSISTDSQISESTANISYKIEYLWSKIGNYTTESGLSLEMAVESNPGSEYRNLKFAVIGEYLGVKKFIDKIEEDPELNFTIDNFNMVSSTASKTVTTYKEGQETKEESTVPVVKATFTVKDLLIINEKTDETVGSNSSSSNSVNSLNTTNSNSTVNVAIDNDLNNNTSVGSPLENKTDVMINKLSENMAK